MKVGAFEREAVSYLSVRRSMTNQSKLWGQGSKDEATDRCPVEQTPFRINSIVLDPRNRGWV